VTTDFTPASFEFFAVEPLFDDDLKLVLAGTQQAEANAWHVPAYLFELQLHSGKCAGRIRLRVGWNDDIIKYAGQIGYAVEPEFRGRRFAARACRLILPLANRHGLENLWITCQPDNIASRRTLEWLGAQYAGTLDVPLEYPLDAGLERKKACFRLQNPAAAKSVS
jgi:predicted acetyltransferase